MLLHSELGGVSAEFKNVVGGVLAALLVSVSPVAFGQDLETLDDAQPPATASEVSETQKTDPLPADGAVETAAAADEPKARRNRLMDEIVVTAQKREENVQDVPLSVTAFSAEALDAKGIDEPMDLAQFTPGMYYGQSVNFSVIYIRGMGTDAYLPDSDPSVATYIDGIYYPFANGQSQAFGAVDHVEVLKGPQGTLFGRNATGGAINIVTKSPNLEDYEVSGQASYGSFDNFKGRVYLNAPVTDWLAFGVSGVYHSSDSYYEGTIDHGTKPLPREIQKGFRAKMLVQPLENVSLEVSYIRYIADGLGSTGQANTQPSLIAQSAGARGEEDYHVNLDVPTYFYMDNKVLYGQAQWQPRWFDMKILASKQDISTWNNFDFDGSSIGLATFDSGEQFAHIQSYEVQLLSNGEWGPEWLEWIVGGFYMDQSIGFPRNRLGLADLDISDGSISLPNPVQGGPLITVPLPQQFIDLYGSLPGTPDGISATLHSMQDTTSLAFFAQATIDFWQWLHLTLGGRYQTEERIVVDSSSYVGTYDQTDYQLFQFDSPRKTVSNFAPKAVIAADLDEDKMVYASYSVGYKSGTFNTVNVYDEVEYVEPEKATTIELGLKSMWFDGLLTFNAAIFQNDIENVQVQFVSLLSGGAVHLENAGEARIRGVEIDFQVSPLPETLPGLVLFGAGAYLDAKYLSYPNASGFDEPYGLYNFGNGDFSGNKVVRAPKFSGSVGANQLFDLGKGDLEIAGSVYYNSGFYYQANNSQSSWEDKYYVVDASISYLHRDWGTRLTLYGKNLSDDRYTYSQFHTDFGKAEYLAPPRNWGIRLNVDL